MTNCQEDFRRKMNKSWMIKLAAWALAIVCLAPLKARSQNLVQYVNPFCGTTNFANTFPGADMPFGMLQWSPETGLNKGGYSYNNTQIWDFSLDHVSGAGCQYGEDFGFMPLVGPMPSTPPSSRSAFATSFSHSNESAKPGYYSVMLDNGIKIELAATTRCGFGRFTYPSGSAETMMINAASAVNGASASSIQIDSAAQSISGSVTCKLFCGATAGGGTTIYFYSVFSQPFSSFSTWSGSALTAGDSAGQGSASGAYVSFDTISGRTVLVRVSISYVSVANAKANLEAELPNAAATSTGFDGVVSADSSTWNSWLSRIEVTGGSPQDLQTFYSMLYHALLFPSTCSDVNGQYMGYDGKVHTTTNGRVQYANFSGWDIYRSECQFLAMIAPTHASDMAQSLLRDYQQGGAFPRWGVPNYDTGVMMGDPAAPIIAGFYAFGARDFDTTAALQGLVKAATDPSVYAPRTNTYERNALGQYLTLGYVPENQNGGYGNVSMTLEYNTDDFAVSQFAAALGDSTDSALLLKHAQCWRNLYNPATGYIQMRRTDGSWAPGFVNNNTSYDNDQAYVEGSAAQYVWMVPFNLKTLADMMGGQSVAVRRLNNFFAVLNAGQNTTSAWLGNEPSLETPYIYDFIGQPFSTQRIVRAALLSLYSPNSNGYPGNDDLGEMSSWYIWAALGMYPELPGSNVLALASPLFSKVVLHLKGGDVTITGNGAGDYSMYVTGLTVNGKTWNKPWIKFSDISNGGTLEYNLSSTADSSWAAAAVDAPPSYPLGAPSVPVPVSPASGDTLTMSDTSLVWQSVPAAGSYELQISTDNAFSSATIDSAGITDTTFALKSLVNSGELSLGTKYYWRVEAVNDTGQGAYSQPQLFVTPGRILAIKSTTRNIPTKFSLSQNYPNPFNPSTIIKYTIPSSQDVSLKVYNVLGQEVESLVDERQGAGNYEVNFDAAPFASGVYFCVLIAGGFTATKEMMLIK